MLVAREYDGLVLSIISNDDSSRIRRNDAHICIWLCSEDHQRLCRINMNKKGKCMGSPKGMMGLDEPLVDWGLAGELAVGRAGRL